MGERMALVGAFALAAACAPSLAAAQFPDLVEVAGQYLPPVPLEDAGGAEVQVASYDLALNAPIVLGERSFLIPGAAYHVDAVAFEDAPPELDQLRTFHGADLALLFVQLLPRDWSLSLRASVGLAGDFQAVDTGMLRYSAMALATHELNEELVLGGGALVSYAFGVLLPLPAVYLEWKPLPQVQVETFLPAFLSVKYIHAERLEIGARADVAGNSYAIRDARVRDDWPCRGASADDPATPQDERVAIPGQCVDHVAYSVATAGVQVAVRLVASVWLSAFGGGTFYRRFELRNDEGGTVEGGDQALREAFVFRAALTWRIPRGE